MLYHHLHRTLCSLCLVSALSVALLPGRAWALNESAHQAVIQLAILQLDEPARNQLEQWYGPQWGRDLIALANWADEARPEPRFSKVVFDEGATSFDLVDNCPGNLCAVAAILESQRVLEDDSFSVIRKREALQFLMHFVTELHVPVNAGRKADNGGLDLTLTSSDLRDVTLDWVWNEDLYSRVSDSWFVQAQRYRRRLPELPVAEWQQSLNPIDWALETHQIALASAYAFAGRGQYDSAYRQAAMPVLETQMIKASARLAATLNGLF
ncbi:S1/P1 nuclease [Saccharospirillum impatiens]|uniref:S1/P1 nuclease n=1 Tax=Saccharospirillum impatiens TaxID=169438 RepID=UPI00040A4116|nr:S1/P1 nuclease [Saccharospirillum impatiens]